MRLSIMVVAIAALALIVLGLALLQVALRWKDENGVFGKYIFVFGAFCAFLLAGMGGFAVGRPLIAWLGLSNKAGLFAELGCFFILLVAIAWGFDKVRNWWRK
jgi:hypothetical protein